MTVKNLERVRWRSRRGLLELDIVLGRFIEQEYAQLDEAGQRAFEALLDMPDNALWDMIVGSTNSTQSSTRQVACGIDRAERGIQQAAHSDQQALLDRIRAV
jgi:antitoxin CptB